MAQTWHGEFTVPILTLLTHKHLNFMAGGVSVCCGGRTCVYMDTVYIYILCACIWGNKDIAMVDMKCMTINSNLNAVDVSNYSTVCVQSDDKYQYFMSLSHVHLLKSFCFRMCINYMY